MPYDARASRCRLRHRKDTPSVSAATRDVNIFDLSPGQHFFPAATSEPRSCGCAFSFWIYLHFGVPRHLTYIF